MSHKSTSKPSHAYSARTSSTGGNNHGSSTTTYSSSSLESATEDPLRRFFVSGTPTGRSAASASREMDQWERGYAAASRR